jgi:catechol 2,3-dioxygenase
MAPAMFSHVGIYVSNLDVMTSFYADVLGLTVTDRGDLNGTPLVFLSAVPAEHHQIVLAAGRPAERGFNPINQLSFRLPDLPALRGMLQMLHARDVAGISPVCHGNALSVYFADPEGNRIECFIDTPWYVNQPLRLTIDLDRPENEVWADVDGLVRSLPGFIPADVRLSEMTELMGQGR